MGMNLQTREVIAVKKAVGPSMLLLTRDAR